MDGRLICLASVPSALPADLDGSVIGLDELRPDIAERVGFLAPGIRDRQELTELVAGLPRLGALQLQTAGVDAVPWDTAGEDVLVCNAAGIHDHSVSELCLAVILASLRGLDGFLDAQRRGRWVDVWSPPQPRRTLVDAEIILVGYGRIARALEHLLEPFGCHIRRVGRAASPGINSAAMVHTLLPTADVVVLLTPLTEATRGLVDARFLGEMKAGALLVNAGRGEVVRTDDLCDALESGHIRAALDVTDPEPLPPGHRLWSSPGLLLTPHAAGCTTGLEDRVQTLVIEQALRFARGQALVNIVRRPDLAVGTGGKP